MVVVNQFYCHHYFTTTTPQTLYPSALQRCGGSKVVTFQKTFYVYTV